MLDYLREDVSQWFTRSVEAYYPIVFIDCIHMKIHCKRSVETEAFYVVLAVREDKQCEALRIFNKPTERALCCGETLAELQERGVRKLGLVCTDGLRVWRMSLARSFPEPRYNAVRRT